MRVSPSVAAPGAGPADGTAHDTEAQVLIAEARARARRRRRRVGLALVCAAALAAAGLTAAGGFAGGRPGVGERGAGPAAAVRQPAPAYYVVAVGRQVVVHASGDGRVTGSVALPGLAGTPRAFVAADVFGGTDDRHFVIVVSRGGDLPGVADSTVFLLGLSAAGRPGQPSMVNFGSNGVPVTGVALSPDGSMLALSLMHEFPPGPRQTYGSVEVISLATGAIRTWTGRGAPGYWAGVPSWAADGTVIVPWWHSASASTIPADLAGVRELDPAAPGGSLLATRLAAFPAPVPDLESAVIAPGGGDIVASSCETGPRHTATARVVELSAADGRLMQVLHTQTAAFRNDADALDAIMSTCQVLSVAGQGGQVLAQAFAFGRIDDGIFTGLPSAALPGTGLPGTGLPGTGLPGTGLAGRPPGVLPLSAAW
jgi:hypothetical protein